MQDCILTALIKVSGTAALSVCVAAFMQRCSLEKYSTLIKTPNCQFLNIYIFVQNEVRNDQSALHPGAPQLFEKQVDRLRLDYSPVCILHMYVHFRPQIRSSVCKSSDEDHWEHRLHSDWIRRCSKKHQSSILMWAACLVCDGGGVGDLKVIYYDIKSQRRELSWETNVTWNDSFCQTSGLSKVSHQVDSRMQSFDRENDPWCFCFTPRLIRQYWSNCFQQLAVCSTCHYFFWVWLFWKCNRKPKITSSCQNEPDLPPTQLLLRLCLPFSLVSSSFSPLVQFPLSSAAGEFWKPWLLPLAAPLTRLTSLSNSEESALITDLWRMRMRRSGLRETTRLCFDLVLLMRSGCFVSAVCRGVTCFSSETLLLLIFDFLRWSSLLSLMLCRLGVFLFFFHVGCQRLQNRWEEAQRKLSSLEAQPVKFTKFPWKPSRTPDNRTCCVKTCSRCSADI